MVDLVNIEDDSERIPASPDDFANGDIVTEDQFHMEENAYVDDDNVGSMEFAFPNTNDTFAGDCPNEGM
jgi:hypothetical protein